MLHVAPVRRCFVFMRWLVCFVTVLCSSVPAVTQTPAKLAGGSVRTVGTVRIDGVPAAAEQTVFAGESIATDLDGAALARFSGFELVLTANSEVSFAPDGQSAVLKRGSFSARSFTSTSSNVMQLRFSQAVLSLAAPDSAVLVGIRADGAAWIECHSGVAVLRRGGRGDEINLRPGDRLGILADGTIENGPAATGASAANPSIPGDPPSSRKVDRRRVPLWVYGAGVGGAVTVAVVALTRSKSTTKCPMSPSSPTCQ
jgi:hypothetical protein